MKINILFPALVTAAVITLSMMASDGLTYIVASLMALSILGALQAFRPGVMKITRWAKANPKKAQWFIAGLQFTLLGLGVIGGKNLRELGYHFSDTSAYVFTAITVIGFLSVPFLRKQNTLVLPKEVDMHRLAYLGISLSGLILTAQVGNKIGDIYPNSPITQVIDKIDQTIFSDQVITFLGYHDGSNPIHSSEASVGGFALFAVMVVDPLQGIQPIDQSVFPGNIAPPEIIKKAPSTKKEMREVKKDLRKANKDVRKKLREATNGGITFLGVILIILLIAAVCAGICLILGAWGVTGAGAVIAGIIVTGGSIYAIVKVVEWIRRKKTEIS